MILARPSGFRCHFIPRGPRPGDHSRAEQLQKFFTPTEVERHYEPDPKGPLVHLYVIDAEHTSDATLRELITGSAGDHLEADDGHPHYGMFVFVTSRSPGPWVRSAEDEREAEAAGEDTPFLDSLKDNEFMIRVFLSHQIGRTVYGGMEGEKGRLEIELQRFVKRCPGYRDLRDALAQLEQNVETLRQIAVDELTPKPMSDLARRISSPELVERSQDAPDAADAPPDEYVQRILEAISTPAGFVDALGRMYQLGRRPHADAEASMTQLSPFGGRGPFLYRRELDLLAQALGKPSPGLLRSLGTLQAGLRTYELLRDLSQWLAFGGSYWARQMWDLDRSQPIPVLLVDEVLASDPAHDPIAPKLREDLIRRLNTIRRAFQVKAGGMPDGVHFDYVAADEVWKHVQRHVAGEIPLCVSPLPTDERQPDPRETRESHFFAYRLILVEVEFRGFYAGPAIVQKICTHLEGVVRERPGQLAPVVMVLSQSANFSHVQQSLNLGAKAFVRKERIYELPMRATRARITHRMAEPAGQKSNFRSLYALRHEEIAALQSPAADDMILGELGDRQERNWLHALPKADLHSHIGTFVDLDTISALAFNTVGRYLERRQNSAELETDALRLIDEVCAIAILTAFEAHKRDAAKQTTADLLVGAANAVLGEDRAPAKSSGKPEIKNPYERVVERLRLKYRKANAFEVTSLLVSVLSLAHASINPRLLRRDSGSVPAPLARWRDFAKLLDWLHRGSNLSAPKRSGVHPDPHDPEALWLSERMMQTDNLLRGISDRISRFASDARRPFGATAPTPRTATEESLAGFETIETALLDNVHGIVGDLELNRTLTKVSTRAASAFRLLYRRFLRVVEVLTDTAVDPSDREQALRMQIPHETLSNLAGRQWGPRSGFAPPPLRDLVEVPANAPANKKDLLRYLWGTGLVGADHFQYPENLLLAALSVVRQSIDENIWYSELRCETIGYTLGGMDAIQATDLLCLALDLAAAYHASRQGRWSRFNVLLGAKRHKSPETFRKIVSLTEFYMQNRTDDSASLTHFAPSWWRPCRVVGFDLSGDENAQQEKPRRLIRPLFAHSTPITIHAGEAASAESIWEAVYSFGARRIGHGLRLRENRRLMDYCISEGICMELCPISNSFTNDFPDAPAEYRSDWWEYYPLRYYMEQGLDVCINTDNRQLHREGTLTAEYLCAARLAGGLTRWETLRLVKMGFKHAFLPRREIAELLQAVEDRVYEIITHPEISWRGVEGSSSKRLKQAHAGAN